MPYRSLYRRQRPKKFSEMVGQEHVSRTLSQALAQGKIAHAYLFCGPRGTGKTTAAKILARALNCERYPAPEPCGQCRPCQNILAGVSLDVLEMDAASNRGIDEIRDLREQTRYASSEGRFKVYIIDEAHMLTTEAFNAFLKTLEEPPPGVVFILATTDPSRLPRTIISRCQRFNFHLLGAEQVCRRLEKVAAEEGWKAETEALHVIAYLAEGSMRDALGLLEQAQPYEDETITAEHVRRITGATRKENMETLIEAIASNDLAAGLALLQEVTSGGGDLSLFLRDLTYCFSRLLLPPKNGHSPGGTYGFDQLVDRFRGVFTREGIMEAVELLHQVSLELRQGYSPRFNLEIGIIRLLRVLDPARSKTAPVKTPVESPAVATRPGLKAVEAGLSREVADPVPGKTAALPGDPYKEEGDLARKAAVGPRDREGTPVAQGRREKEIPPSDQQWISIVKQRWPELLAEAGKVQKSTGALLAQATCTGCRDNCILFSFKAGQAVLSERIMEAGHRKIIEKVLSRLLAAPVCIDVDPYNRETEEEPASEEAVGVPGPEEPGPVGGADLVEEAARIFNGKIFGVNKREG